MAERDQEAQRNHTHVGDPDPRSTTVMPDELLDLASAESASETGEGKTPPSGPGSEDELVAEDDAKRRHREASRRGGLKGGRARAAKLSAERRSEIARAAARARWAKRRRDSA